MTSRNVEDNCPWDYSYFEENWILTSPQAVLVKQVIHWDSHLFGSWSFLIVSFVFCFLFIFFYINWPVYFVGSSAHGDSNQELRESHGIPADDQGIKNTMHNADTENRKLQEDVEQQSVVLGRSMG